ncbi:type I-E CRISPR-associated endonuclease Cas1e [Stratiformator vulcanicus]|uniref:CRISPR-associated endonuclease Cas1 n=1 Tax=Stratiformator vulcanicus TaxID=2527980 RepID=A0A517R133_9PLAN|nr:type I-E CRISPR-associated endonuclease Cas1e [Stratiformator vulcanicus]QDT37588.1 CRISPR-associated endonuclease Cas1 [Stratiformator vulcanicus]
MQRNLHDYARFGDRLSFLYLEKGRIEQEAKAIAYVTELGRTPIPVSGLSTLMLGPGATITQKAIDNLSDCDCTVIWCAEQGVRYYAHGRGGTHSASRLIHQAKLVSIPRLRREVVARMYSRRFGETVEPDVDIRTIRGREGYRVRTAYERLAEEHGVQWKGRNYDYSSWEKGDPLNRALSAASACLNGVCHAGIVAAGYSSALGFIHTGKMLSFVYDVADLFKIDLIVPLAFRTVAESDKSVERRVRIACRDVFTEQKFLSRLLPEIEKVLGNDSHDSRTRPDQPAGRPEPVDDRAEGRDIPRQSECAGP